ncbi:hypothetical protein IFM89_000232 [Coptis chinensis]|uniref:Pentatricopeptide repeat-containing protein n=1 Tax=Coptis chinensis TaxID=261450 RepID=A0A835I8V5_9MAGN|nr:hypothetical protein IFM89_000232 [Coptis chinensis]
MKKSGCHPNSNTFKMLISTFCKNDDFDGAVQVLNEMMERCLTPESGLLVELCEGLRRYRKFNLATKVCTDLQRRRLLPKGFEEPQMITVDGETDDDDKHEKF